MPGEVIDTAFVEIAPILAPNFQGQVAAGIRQGATGAVKREGAAAGGLLGGSIGKDFLEGFAGVTVAAIGVEKLAGFLHDSVQDAAILEKQQEAIRAEFGASAEDVLKFAESSKSIGIGIKDSEQLSVRIGILAHNLHIGQGQAANMTIDLQKLAGAIAAIRGLDPDQVMANLPQVLAGNLRSLKQLGFAFSATQIQQEAVTQGAIRQGQALTPTAKALGIYGLLVKQLPFFEAQAAKHADDLTNQQHRLGAEVDDLQEGIGSLVTGPMADFVKLANDDVKAANELVGGLKKVKDTADSIHLPGFLGGSSVGSRLRQGFEFAVKFGGPAGTVRQALWLIDRASDTFKAPQDISVRLRVTSVLDPGATSVLGLGGPLSGQSRLGPPAPTPRAFQDFLPTGPQIDHRLQPQLNATQQAVVQRVQDLVEEARAGGSTAKLKAALAEERQIFVNIENNRKLSLAIRRSARVTIAQLDEQVRGIDQQAADDAKNAAQDAKNAAERRQDALLDRMTTAADFRRRAAATTDTTLKDDIAAQRHYIATLQREVSILRSAHRDAHDLTDQIKTERLALAGLVKQQADDRAAAEEDRLQDLATIAGTTKGTGDDIRAQTALERFYQAKVNAAERGSVARRKWLVKLRQTQQEIRQLREEQDKTAEEERKAIMGQQFNFLTTQRGFFSNLAGNLLGTNVGGLVGGLPSSTPGAPGTPALPHPDTRSAVAARSRDPRDPSSSQLDTLIRLARVTANALTKIASDHPHSTSRETNALVTAASDAGGAR